MEESSTIQALIEEGRRKGLEEGLEEGRAGEARKIILRQGRIRFGEAGNAVESRNGDPVITPARKLRILSTYEPDAPARALRHSPRWRFGFV